MDDSSLHCPQCGETLAMRLGLGECPKSGFPPLAKQTAAVSTSQPERLPAVSSSGSREEMQRSISQQTGYVTRIADRYIPGLDYCQGFVRQKRLFLKIFGYAQVIGGLMLKTATWESAPSKSNPWAAVLGLLLPVVISLVLLYLPFVALKRAAIAVLCVVVGAYGFAIYRYADGYHEFVVYKLLADVVLALWLIVLLAKDIYWLHQLESQAIHADPYLERADE